jgi:hypothetical protein
MEMTPWIVAAFLAGVAFIAGALLADFGYIGTSCENAERMDRYWGEALEERDKARKELSAALDKLCKIREVFDE